MQYNRRFVNVVATFGRRRGPNSNAPWTPTASCLYLATETCTDNVMLFRMLWIIDTNTKLVYNIIAKDIAQYFVLRVRPSARTGSCWGDNLSVCFWYTDVARKCHTCVLFLDTWCLFLIRNPICRKWQGKWLCACSPPPFEGRKKVDLWTREPSRPPFRSLYKSGTASQSRLSRLSSVSILGRWVEMSTCVCERESVCLCVCVRIHCEVYLVLLYASDVVWMVLKCSVKTFSKPSK